MSNERKTKKKLIEELEGLRGKITELEGAMSEEEPMLRREQDLIELNRMMISASTFGIIVYKASGQCVIANETAAKSIGATREQVLQQNFYHIESWEKSGLLEAAKGALKDGSDKKIEIHTISTFGKDIWLGCRFTPFVYLDEQYLMLIFENITDRIIVSQELQRTRDELKEKNEKLEKEISEGRKREEIIRRQHQEILELSTPVMKICEGVVAAPLIGTLDSQRTQQFMDVFLNAIVDNNAPVALVDITGVPTIDTQTGQHLIEAISAARLLGTEVILTGVRPAIAQTLVHLGIDLSDLRTCSSLSAGLSMALRTLNREVISRDDIQGDL